VQPLLARYPASNAHAPYCHLWPAPLYNIFPRYLINDTIFEKRYWTKICVSLLLLSHTFFILRITERDMIKNVYWFSCKEPILLVRLEWNSNFLDRFWKNTQISNLMKSIQWEPSCSIRTDRHDEANNRFSQFYKRTYKIHHVTLVMIDFNPNISVEAFHRKTNSYTLSMTYPSLNRVAVRYRES
jgi:hypothetical protein